MPSGPLRRSCRWLASGLRGAEPAGPAAVPRARPGSCGCSVRPARPVSPAAALRRPWRRQAVLRRGGGADAALATLLDDVRKSARPTLVIATSDHGEGLGDHGEEAHGILRVRVDLARSADHGENWAAPPPVRSARTGEVSHAAARHVDILPTILDAAGSGAAGPAGPDAAAIPRAPRGRRSPAPPTSKPCRDAHSRMGALAGVIVTRQVHRPAIASATTWRRTPLSGRTCTARRPTAIGRLPPR